MYRADWATSIAGKVVQGQEGFPTSYNLTFASSSENLWQSGSEVLNLQESKFSEVEIPNVTLSQIFPQFGAESQVYAVRNIAVSFKQSAGQIVLISCYGSITHEARPHLIPVHLINNSTGSPLGLWVNSPWGSTVIKAIHKSYSGVENAIEFCKCSVMQFMANPPLATIPSPKEKKSKQEPRWQASNCQHSLSQYQKRLLGLRDFRIWSCFFCFVILEGG